MGLKILYSVIFFNLHKRNLFTGIADPNAETGDGTETSFVMQVEGVSDTITGDASNEDVS